MERGVAALEIIPPRPMRGEEGGGMIRIAPFRTCTRGGRAVNREFEHTTANKDSQEFVVLRRGVGGSNVFTDPPIVN